MRVIGRLLSQLEAKVGFAAYYRQRRRASCCAQLTPSLPRVVTWIVALVRRQQRLFGRTPRQASFDGAVASRDNLAVVKALSVAGVCFAKQRGLAIRDMVRSACVYDTLRRFRAGIEAGISLLERVFGLARCIRKGAAGFHAYVRAAVLAANLLLLARHRLA